MGLNLDAVGSNSAAFERSWTQTDALIYALGVGAGSPESTDELEFTTENSEGVVPRVLPTFTTVIGQEGAVLGLGGNETPSIGQYDLEAVLHADQSVRLHEELPPAGRISVSTRIEGMYDKGHAALVVLESTAHLVDTGRPAFTNRTTLFIRGEGGFGGPRRAESNEEDDLVAAPVPERRPDDVVAYTTRRDQALLYRLSGDRNPLHSDPVFAARAGFERPILHGLCTYGFTGRALLHSVCGSDPSRFGAMRARFSRPTMPGDTLTVSIWEIGDVRPGSYRFTTSTGPGENVMESGLFTLAR
jgi:acyl dehydratase